MKELTERHTAEYLKTVILTVLKDYNINLNQIYSITSDNGANMLKSTQLLRDDLDIEFSSAIDNSDLAISDFSNIESIRQAVSVISEESHGLINCIRCAAHTLQLIFADATKENNIDQQIQKF